MERIHLNILIETCLEKSCEYIKLKDGDVVIAGEVNGGLQSHGL